MGDAAFMSARGEDLFPNHFRGVSAGPRRLQVVVGSLIWPQISHPARVPLVGFP
jgi:hypothetical protein